MAKYLGFWMGPAVDEHSWVSPMIKFCRRTKDIAAAWVAPGLGATWFGLRAAPVLGYVAQLAPMAKDTRKKEMWALNKLLHAPGCTFAAKMGGDLAELGLLRAPSVSTRCTAALLRTALDGKIAYAPALRAMATSAVDFVPQSLWAKDQWWDSHWCSPPFALIFWQASKGEVAGWKPAELAGPVAAAVTKIKGRRTPMQQRLKEKTEAWNKITS